MSDPFIKLKSAMKKSVFNDLTFSDERKNAVKQSIRSKHSQAQLHLWNEETLLTVFESLQYEAKHGFDISTQLFQKNDHSFHNNEGQLYTLLHLLESKGILTSKWREGKKYYSLTSKGGKRLPAYKQGKTKQHSFLKNLLTEASL